MTTFERYYIEDPEEFGLDGAEGRIINGHVPVHQLEGENPVKCGGKKFLWTGRTAHEPFTGRGCSDQRTGHCLKPCGSSLYFQTAPGWGYRQWKGTEGADQ